jgi:hypothetical protein
VSDLVQCKLTKTQNDQEATAVVLTMCESRKTLVCYFNPANHLISTFEIREWVYSQLEVTKYSVLMIQKDGTRRHVFIKLTASTFVRDILHTKNGTIEYKHTTGKISPVRLEIVGMYTRRIHLANLPPELPGSAIRTALAPYGDIQSIQDENWS